MVSGMVSFYALSVQFPVLGQLSCDRKTGNQLHKGLKVWYKEWLALHQILAGNVTHNFMLETTTKQSMLFLSSGVVVTLERYILLRLRSNCN